MNTTIIPAPRRPISIRPASMSDLPFVDHLQKMHTKQVGWMPRKQLEGKIAAGHVLVAEAFEPRRHGGTENEGSASESCPPSSSVSQCLRGESVGYVIARDQYFKHDDVGIIYQLNVLPDRQRGFIGAHLLKAVFDRAAYGCKLFCCWCAQDIQANHFWESMGFIPLAFRTGSRSKQRIHIFWQRRIREGDQTTPYWFPSQTSAGSLREDRLVLPIPPGTSWRDAKPLILPRSVEDTVVVAGSLPGPNPPGRRSHEAQNPPKRAIPRLNGINFAPSPSPQEPRPGSTELAKAKRAPRQRVKNDPKLIAAARELRDKWLEHVSLHPQDLLSNGKYDVSRAIANQEPRTMPVLEAA